DKIPTCMKLIFSSVLISMLVLLWIVHSEVNAVLPSPLKQIQSGISAHDVKCNVGFVLIMRSSNDHHPVCVRPTSEQRLLANGWIVPNLETTQIINHNETINTVKHYNLTPLISNYTNNTSSEPRKNANNDGT